MPAPRKPARRRATPARRSQAQRRERMRTKLIEATLWCLAHKGYAATGVREVCARARVSRGAWHHHFPSMDALILESAQHLLARVYERFGTLMQSWAGGARAIPDVVRAAWTEFFVSEVNDVYLELLLASRRDRKLARLLRDVAVTLDRSIDGTARRFFAAPAGAVSTPAEVLVFNRWVLRGLALDAHLIPPARIDAYLAAWSRLVATQLRPGPDGAA